MKELLSSRALLLPLFAAGMFWMSPEQTDPHPCDVLPYDQSPLEYEIPTPGEMEKTGIQTYLAKTPEQLSRELLSVLFSPRDTVGLYEEQEYRLHVEVKTIEGTQSYWYLYDPSRIRFVQLSQQGVQLQRESMIAHELFEMIALGSGSSVRTIVLQGVFRSNHRRPLDFIDPPQFVMFPARQDRVKGDLNEDTKRSIEEATIHWTAEGIAVVFRTGTQYQLMSGETVHSWIEINSLPTGTTTSGHTQYFDSQGTLIVERTGPYDDSLVLGLEPGSQLTARSMELSSSVPRTGTPLCT